MKKILLFAAAGLVMISCGNKSEKENDAADTEAVAEVVVEEADVEAQRMDSISQAQEAAFVDPSFYPTVEIGEDNVLFLTNEGNLGLNDPNFSNGKYVKDNGGYLMFWGYGDVPSSLGVIYGDKYYQLNDNTENPDENLSYLMDYFMSNFFVEENPFAGYVWFNPDTRTVTYKTENGEGTFKLSDVPESNIKPVHWSK